MAKPLIDVTLTGSPVAQGSMEAWVIYKDRKRKVPHRRPDGSILVNVTAHNEKALKEWRAAIAAEVRLRFRDEPLAEVGLTLEATSFLKRPGGDWGTGRNAHLVKDSADAFPTGRPDADKLLRAVCDALAEVVYHNDAQVTDMVSRKRYGVPTAANPTGEGLRVRIWVNRVQRAVDLPLEDRYRDWTGSESSGEQDDAQASLLAA